MWQIDVKEFSNRLKDAAKSVGILTATQLYEAVKKVENSATYSGVRPHWEARGLPEMRYLSAYAIVTQQSLDYLWFGKIPPQPEKLTEERLREVVDSLLAEHNLEGQSPDPDIREIMILAKRLDQTLRDNLLNIIRQMAKGE